MSDYLRYQVLHLMVNGLVDDNPLRNRLAGIATYLAPRILNQFEDEPVLKGKMLKILDRLSSVKAGPGDDGNIDATVKRLSDGEAKSIAEDIVQLVFDEMRDE